MTKTILGIFSDQIDAENAINTLKRERYNPKDISILMKDAREGEDLANDTGSNMVGGALSGATAGALLGGLAGLLAGFAIPGLGAFFIGGPIASALGLTGAAATTASGAATGALAGGLLGALTGFGLSEDDARTYEERIKKGGILVAVPARIGEEAIIMEIFVDNNAGDIKAISSDETRDRFEERLTTSKRVDQDNQSYQQPLHASTKGGRAASDKKGLLTKRHSKTSKKGKSTTSRSRKN